MTPMPAAFLGHGSPMSALEKDRYTEARRALPPRCSDTPTSAWWRTPDHLIPLLFIAGLAYAADSAADVLIDGYEYGSLSMTAYTLEFPGLPPKVL